MRREEFVFIQHVLKRATQSIARWDRQHPVSGKGANFAIGDKRREVLAIIEEPFHALLEARKLIDLLSLEIFHRDQREQTYARSRPQRNHLPIDLELIVVETVCLIPQTGAA